MAAMLAQGVREPKLAIPDEPVISEGLSMRGKIENMARSVWLDGASSGRTDQELDKRAGGTYVEYWCLIRAEIDLTADRKTVDI